MVEAAFKFIDRNPRWFAAGLVIHTTLIKGVLAGTLLIGR